MDQVGSVCACNRSQSLALPGEKALPVGYPDGRDSRICNRNLFGGALMQRRTAVTMRQDADVSQQHSRPLVDCSGTLGRQLRPASRPMLRAGQKLTWYRVLNSPKRSIRTKGVSVSTSRLFLGEGQAGIGIQSNIGEDSRAKPRIRGSRNHSRVIRRKRPAGKKYFDARGLRALFKRRAQPAV